MRNLLTTSLLFSVCLAAQEGEITSLPDDGDGYQHVERFIKILEEVRSNHPDADKVSYERLVNHALEGMLDSLDTFTAFYHPETVQHMDFDGPAIEEQFAVHSLGMSLSKRDGKVYLGSVRAHSPAERAGLRQGDTLLRVDEQDLTELDLPEATKTLMGQPGQSLQLTIYRKSARREITVDLLHAVIKQAALPDAFLLNQYGAPEIGYTRLTQFTATAARELEAALDEMEDQGMNALILDLRGNPGGLLNISVDILSLFLPPNTEVVTTQGRSPSAQQPALKTAERQRVKREYPLVVLLDRNSASASELVGAALQDLERATLIGETSFGKGSVQNITSRDGGTALRLTFATYHTPSGRTPHEVGVDPDIAIAISEVDLSNFERFKTRLTAPPETQDILKKWTDPVLKAAIEHLQKPSE
ncbi:MAG: S41 family peptidase [Roseibacillus sp.]